MIKNIVKNSVLFIRDNFALYLFTGFVMLFELWITVLQSNSFPLFYNLFLPEIYVLLIMTFVLAIRWRKQHRLATQTLAENSLEDISEQLARTSQEQLLLSLLNKALSEKSTLSEEQRKEAQTLEDYYALWAHQIKVPLSVLDLMNQTDTIDKKQTAEQLFLVNQYLDMLLSFIRLQDMNSDLTLTRLSARSIVLTVLKEYKVFFIQKDLSLIVSECDFDLVTDKKWLTFVLEQVIFNAIKYTKTGGIRITCTKDQQIIIQDSGIGIDPADLPQVFQHGYTGFNGRVEDNASGLGLYLVKEILDRLGHTITIESTVGVGTKVTIDCSQQRLS